MNHKGQKPRPKKNEYYKYYDGYVSLVSEGDISDILKNQQISTIELLKNIPESKGNYSYAPQKWSLKQVIGHIIDVEWIFTYRALRFARGDKSALAGMDQDEFIAGANFQNRKTSDLIEEYKHLRSANTVLFDSFDEEIFNRTGEASGYSFTVRSILYIIAGHELHHIKVIKERYL